MSLCLTHYISWFYKWQKWGITGEMRFRGVRSEPSIWAGLLFLAGSELNRVTELTNVLLQHLCVAVFASIRFPQAHAGIAVHHRALHRTAQPHVNLRDCSAFDDLGSVVDSDATACHDRDPVAG